MVCLATAHPAKFADTVVKATGTQPEMPDSVAGLTERESRCKILDADVEQVKAFVRNNSL
jgi:threonine synthase